MYHLLVKYDGWKSPRDTLGAIRVFEFTRDDLIQKFMLSGNLDISEISRWVEFDSGGISVFIEYSICTSFE
jgi:hypothetical protein